MAYLIAVSATFLLLIAFLALSWLETRQGARLFAGTRARLDAKTARAAYIATHIDWGSFVRHISRSTAERVAHDIVHAILVAVRATERELTRIIRVLRERVARNAPAGEKVEGSQLVATIVRFRKNLRRKSNTPAE